MFEKLNPNMEKNNEKGLNFEKSLAVYKNNDLNNNNNNINNNLSNSNSNIKSSIDSVDESDSNNSSEESISKFDKYVYTFLLCFANLSYGMALTCMSPALLDFECVVDSDSEIVTHYFTLFAIGTIIGSLFGFLFKYVNRQFILMLALLLFGLVTCLLPISPDFLVFYLFGFIGGIGSGTLDIVQTVWLIEMWELTSGSVLQLSECAYGIGITIGPLLVSPFVSGSEGCNETHSANETTINYSEKLLPPFLISGSLQIVCAILLGVMYFCHKYIPMGRHEEKEMIEQEIEQVLRPIEKIYQRRYTVQIIEEGNSSSRMSSLKRRDILAPRFSIQVIGARKSIDNKLTLSKRHSMPLKRKWSSFQTYNQNEVYPVIAAKLPRKTVIGLGAVCFATMIVAETAYIDFSPTFFHFYSGVKSSQTAVMLSAMTGSYALTRAASIFIAIRIRPEYILTVHYILTFISLSILYFADQNQLIMWFGNILFGIAVATFWSATFSHIENYFEVTDRIGTIYVSALGLLEIGTQFIEGPFLEDNPEVLIFYCTAASIISFISFIAIRIIVYKTHVDDISAQTSCNSSIAGKEQNVTTI